MQKLMDRDRKIDRQIIRNMIDIEICKKAKEHDLWFFGRIFLVSINV